MSDGNWGAGRPGQRPGTPRPGAQRPGPQQPRAGRPGAQGQGYAGPVRRPVPANQRPVGGPTEGPSGQSAKQTKKKGKRKHPVRRFFAWTFGILTGLFIIGALAFAYLYANTAIPSANELAKAQTSVIYFADGKTQLATVGEVNRTSIPFKEIPVVTQHAMLAAEDRNFYDEHGFSPSGIARAAWVTLRGGQTQGGSTITQQYVKNYFLSQDQNITRKVKELMISLKIEQVQSKDEILANYMNTIYYGRGAYGIQAAAQAYFGKDAKNLDVAESALLASVIRGPSFYDPSLSAANAKRAKDRVKYVLDGMVSQGWLSSAQRAKVTFPTVVKATQKQRPSGPNGYLIDVVEKDLVDRGIVTEDEINRGGLRITTTIDKNRQAEAIKAVENNLPSSGTGARLRAGLAAIKPGDGAILALYGGADYAKTQWNDATQTHLQAGSTFKIFTLVAALEKGISTKTRYPAPYQMTLPGWPDGVRNDSRSENWDSLDLRKATAMSVNTVYAQVNNQVGPDTTRKTAEKMGIPVNGTGTGDSWGLNDLPSNVLGTAAVRPIDMANAYATIAAGGVKAQPYIVRSLTSNDGSITYTSDPRTEQVFSKEVAADAIDAMESVITSGTGRRAAIGRPAAGKTGTTTSNKAAWFDGFTPQIATAVGMYLPDSKGNALPMEHLPGLGSVYGGDMPTEIWHDFMRSALQGVEVQDFPSRSGVGDEAVPVPAPSDTSSASDSPTPSDSGSSTSSSPSSSTSSAPASPTSASATPSPTVAPTPSRTSPTTRTSTSSRTTHTPTRTPTTTPTRAPADGATINGVADNPAANRAGSGASGTSGTGGNAATVGG